MCLWYSNLSRSPAPTSQMVLFARNWKSRRVTDEILKIASAISRTHAQRVYPPLQSPAKLPPTCSLLATFLLARPRRSFFGRWYLLACLLPQIINRWDLCRFLESGPEKVQRRRTFFFRLCLLAGVVFSSRRAARPPRYGAHRGSVGLSREPDKSSSRERPRDGYLRERASRAATASNVTRACTRDDVRVCDEALGNRDHFMRGASLAVVRTLFPWQLKRRPDDRLQMVRGKNGDGRPIGGFIMITAKEFTTSRMATAAGWPWDAVTRFL